MALKNFPSCGHNSIFVPLVPAVGYDGTLFGGKSEGFCNNPMCDQLLWYYPSTGQVTRRNVGVTLKEYGIRRADIDVFNITRRRAGLFPVTVDKPPIAVLFPSSGGDSDITEGDPALDYMPWYERAVDKIAGWCYLFLAAVKSPFQKD